MEEWARNICLNLHCPRLQIFMNIWVLSYDPCGGLNQTFAVLRWLPYSVLSVGNQTKLCHFTDDCVRRVDDHLATTSDGWQFNSIRKGPGKRPEKRPENGTEKKA